MTTSAPAVRDAIDARRAERLWPAVVVAALGIAFVLRLALVWSRVTPNYFPDEYLYAELGRSLASAGRPEVRGHAAHFPALLQPLLTAPAWLAGSAADAYRIIQALGAAAVTLAAVPVYLLARRLELGRVAAVGAAGLAVVVPDTVFAGFVVAEPFAYPLALGAVAAGVAALARPTWRAQLAFAALALLATAARAQLAVLPLAFTAAAVIVALRERRPRALREQLPILATLAAGAAVVLASGPARVVGSYGAVLHPHVSPDAVVHAIGRNGLVLAFAAGWVLVPGALLGVWLALRRPRSRAELAFGALVAPLAAGLLLEAALFGEPDKVQERYLFYLLPLGAVAFGLYAARRWPYRTAHAFFAACLAAAAARVPLAAYAQKGFNDHSPLVWAVDRLELVIGSTSGASLVAAGAAAGLSLAAVACSFRPRAGTIVAVALALAASSAAFAGAASFDHAATAGSRSRYLPADAAWVDHARAGGSTLLVAPGGRPPGALQQLFWNRSIHAVAMLPGALPIDTWAASSATIAPDGRILVGGAPVRGPLVLDGSGSTARLAGATLLARAPQYALWRPHGEARLALYFLGRSADGWLGGSGAAQIWPREGRGLAGTVKLRLTAPAAPARFELDDGSRHWIVRLRPGSTKVLHLRACGPGPWRLALVAKSGIAVRDGRLTSARASLPVYVRDPAACR